MPGSWRVAPQWSVAAARMSDGGAVEHDARGALVDNGGPFAQTVIAVLRVRNGQILSYPDYINGRTLRFSHTNVALARGLMFPVWPSAKAREAVHDLSRLGPTRETLMNVALWIVAGLLALALLASGV